MENKPKLEQQIPSHATKVFSGVIFDVYQWEQELYDGTTVTFEKLKRSDSVVVFAVLDDGRILLTEQEQPGRALFITATGGRVDANESVVDAARRELLEESGYEATELVLWDVCQPTLKVDWLVHTFVAKGLKKITDMRPDAGEKIILKPVTFEEFLDIVPSEQFRDEQIVKYIYEAKLYPSKMEALRALLSP